MKQENPLWGARRIRDELKKISIKVSHETISKILNRFRKTGDLKPSLSWKRFLASHWETLFACDFLTVTIFFGIFAYGYAVCLFHHGTQIQKDCPIRHYRQPQHTVS